MIYHLPLMPYGFNALEPVLDARTVQLHYERHHGGCVSSLNRILEGRTRLSRMSLQDIIADISVAPEEVRQDIRNSGGGHLNHSLLWHVLGPSGSRQPQGILAEAISSFFGDFSTFQQEFTRACLSRFGSGWGWLCVDARGRMEILTTPNEDSPIMLGCRPIYGVDLWEHAYYYVYQDRRSEYIAALWQVVNWDNVQELYAHCVDLVMRTK